LEMLNEDLPAALIAMWEPEPPEPAFEFDPHRRVDDPDNVF
jgi:hypothetical protein